MSRARSHRPLPPRSQWLYTTPPCGHLLRYESLAQDFRTAFAASPRLAEVDLTAAKSNAAPCEMRVGDLSDESRVSLAPRSPPSIALPCPPSPKPLVSRARLSPGCGARRTPLEASCARP